jgi:hypothetical protein
MDAALPKPDVIITHESDLDGLLSGLLLKRLARKLFDTDVTLCAYQNDSWQKRPLTEKSGWVTDFSFDERLDKPGWVVIDHHSTAITARNARLIHDASKCSSRLCYELCCQAGLGTPNLDRLVHLTDVGDLFLQQDPDFILAGDYAGLVKTYQFWNLVNLTAGEPERLLDHPLLQVIEVKRRVEDPLGLEWARSHVVPLTPTVGLVDMVIGNSNLIVHQLLNEKSTPYSVLLTLLRKGNGTVVVSLRSMNGEAIKVAERLHGGGHPNASGATLPRSVQGTANAADYLRKILNPTANSSPNVSSLENVFDALLTQS